jgi:hypothetical protein
MRCAVPVNRLTARTVICCDSTTGSVERKQPWSAHRLWISPCVSGAPGTRSNFTTAAVLLAEDLDTDVPINRYPTNSAFLPVTRQPRETSPSISARHCSD